MKEILKEEWKKGLIGLFFSLILLAIGFIASELTYDFRDHLHKGQIVFVSNNIFKGKVTVESQSGDIETLTNLHDGTKIYLEPGQYKISQYLGNFQIGEDTVQVVKRRVSEFILTQDSDQIFNFLMSTDKKVYGPGDQLYITLFSTKTVWVFFYSFIDGKIIKMNREGFLLNAYSGVTMNNIKSKTSPGKDNIIAIATDINDAQYSDSFLDQLIYNSKSEIFCNTENWRSQWITFLVE